MSWYATTEGLQMSLRLRSPLVQSLVGHNPFVHDLDYSSSSRSCHFQQIRQRINELLGRVHLLLVALAVAVVVDVVLVLAVVAAHGPSARLTRRLPLPGALLPQHAPSGPPGVPAGQARRQHAWPIVASTEPLGQDPHDDVDVEHRVRAPRAVRLDGQLPKAERAMLFRLLPALHLADRPVHDATDDINLIFGHLLQVFVGVRRQDHQLRQIEQLPDRLLVHV
mmetsp:Transcript_40179/g.127167  ORF Transcript_40179/g.127167 Transcript_40179/m.127167 type:complete len:223 (-) Transcript_40179:676-1344(-)